MEAEAEGCGGVEEGTAAGERETLRGPVALALRLDPARDLQRLHALLVAHAHCLDQRLHHPHNSTHFVCPLAFVLYKSSEYLIGVIVCHM